MAVVEVPVVEVPVVEVPVEEFPVVELPVIEVTTAELPVVERAVTDVSSAVVPLVAVVVSGLARAVPTINVAIVAVRKVSLIIAISDNLCGVVYVCLAGKRIMGQNTIMLRLYITFAPLSKCSILEIPLSGSTSYAK